jgi:hypothetical protein
MEEITNKVSKIKINKGTGAGGANTTLNGGAFENITSIESMLLSKNFTKKKFTTSSDYYMEKNLSNPNIRLIYVKQFGLKTFMEEFYASSAIRKPDEAFICIEKSNGKDKLTINILEKKYQSVEGSVDVKLWAGCALKREYELYYENKHTINYSFALSEYLINKINSEDIKWVILKKILKENDINVFNPADLDYFTQVINWGFPCLKSQISKNPNKVKNKSKKQIEIEI